MSVKENIEKLRERIDRVCKKCGRNPEEIIIVGATKTVPPEKILEAIDCGIKIIGENRVQEALQKYEIIGDKVEWHMIGHLQRNKVKKALQIFKCIQSLDSLRLAEEIQKRATQPIDVLVEVNTSFEPTKFGLHPDEVIDFVKKVSEFDRIRIKGLMTIGPLGREPRDSFRTLRKLFDKIDSLNIIGVEMKFLSMGMTDDFEIAIEEGSNMIRIGRAIFGERR